MAEDPHVLVLGELQNLSESLVRLEAAMRMWDRSLTAPDLQQRYDDLRHAFYCVNAHLITLLNNLEQVPTSIIPHLDPNVPGNIEHATRLLVREDANEPRASDVEEVTTFFPSGSDEVNGWLAEYGEPIRDASRKFWKSYAVLLKATGKQTGKIKKSRKRGVPRNKLVSKVATRFNTAQKLAYKLATLGQI